MLDPNLVSSLNSHYSTLLSNEQFTGRWEDCWRYNSLVVSCKSDVDGTLYVDFSPDNNNADSTLTYNILGGVSETHKLSVSRKSFRIRYVNGSSNQSYLRLQCILGSQSQLTSAVNTQVYQDSDASIVRSIPAEYEISAGRFTGYSVVNKFGRNTDIDTASVPEDIWNGGGLYTGFPQGSPEEFEVVSSSASDTGVLTFTYLASNTSESYQTANVTLTGTTPVNTGITGYRLHTARYNSGNSTTFNVGNITVRHRITTANVFCLMPIGTSQTYVSGYTVPYGSTGLITRLFCRILSNVAASVEGALFVRTNGNGPRLRRPFVASNVDGFEESVFGGLRIEANSDIMVRITSANSNNLDIIGGYDILIIKN